MSTETTPRIAVSELNSAIGKAFHDDQVSAIKASGAALPLVREMENRLILVNTHAAINNQVIRMLIAAGHITPEISTKAFNIAHGFEDGELPPAQTAAGIPADWVEFVNLCAGNSWLAVEENTVSRRARELLNPVKFENVRPGHREALAIQILVDAGFVTAAKANEALQIAFGGRAGPLKPAANRSWWKDVKPETDLADANDVIVCMLEDWQKVGEALGFKDFADPESIIGVCTGLFEGAPMAAAEAIVLLNGVIAKLERDDEYGLEPDLREALWLLTYGATHAKGEPSRSDEFADIREFRRRAAEMDQRDAERADAEHEAFIRSIFPFQEVAKVAAREAASAYMEMVTKEFESPPVNPGRIHEPPAVMVVQFKDFPRNENTRKLMDEVEKAAAQYRSRLEQSLTTNIVGQLQPFPFDGVPKDGSIPVYGGDPEFDALPIGAGSTPEAPAPIPRYAHEAPCVVQEDNVSRRAGNAAWARDDEKTMLRILLLSAETTGFHGNDPAVHLARIAKWTDDECRAVDDWCVAMHLHAGDRGVRVPPKPSVLVSERPAVVADPMDVIRQALEPVNAEEFERLVLSIIVAETRYPTHHFTRAAKMITELHARGAAE